MIHNVRRFGVVGYVTPGLWYEHLGAGATVLFMSYFSWSKYLYVLYHSGVPFSWWRLHCEHTTVHRLDSIDFSWLGYFFRPHPAPPEM